MSLRYLGPVKTDFHGDPTFSWDSTPKPGGARGVTVGGVLDWPQAEQLSELVANDARRQTVGADTGVLVYVYADDVRLHPFNGWVLLQSMSLNASYEHSIENWPVPFALNAVHLGAHRQVVVTRSDRDRTNSFGLDSQAIVADPFVGGSFVRSPGGTLVTREYDPNPHDPARVSTTPAEMDVYLAPTAEVILAAPEGR